MKPTIVLWHGPSCADGWCSALAAWMHLGEQADYQGVNYGQPLPDVNGRQEVYLLDFCPDRGEDLVRLAEQVPYLVVIDHHRSSPPKLAMIEGRANVMVIFDESECGATLTWGCFRPAESRPWLFDVIRARDLWVWDQTYSREINAWLEIQERTFWEWQVISMDLERPTIRNPIPRLTQMAFERGGAILAYQKQTVDRLVKHARPVLIAGHQVPAVNTPILQSEVGEALAKTVPHLFAACYSHGEDGWVRWSLRSAPGGLDVSEVAEEYAGGGHRQAAGFHTDLTTARLMLLGEG